ncbi:hypothetical protein [Paractinoplanes hotanensis]|uniref:Uncharacterized protein n=1 Tax=Paractinoplanes hotanensis TaxID=2906497 RepID=A0ABT0Y3B1_9ACTN|nr:hypothetical protein [Actinoplanes hotanensis]MCM4080355.1 hypothetical protein [Actinoplanes hotanensis]
MSWNPRTAHRVAAIDAYRFPAAVRQRLASEHDSLSQAGLDQVESATRQWFRLAARHPRAKLTMPSLIAAALWTELSRQATEYAAFCTEAFGRASLDGPSPSGPTAPASPSGPTAPASPSGPTAPASSSGPAALADTFRFARQDENCGPAALPLLFRIDQQLAIRGGYRYLADCGGRGTCYDVPGAVCLQHLKGHGRLLRGRNRFGPPPPGNSGPAGGGMACGGGCGSS